MTEDVPNAVVSTNDTTVVVSFWCELPLSLAAEAAAIALKGGTPCTDPYYRSLGWAKWACGWAPARRAVALECYVRPAVGVSTVVLREIGYAELEGVTFALTGRFVGKGQPFVWCRVGHVIQLDEIDFPRDGVDVAACFPPGWTASRIWQVGFTLVGTERTERKTG